MVGGYSQDNIAAMQEDALKRVREMQKKAKQKVRQNQMFNIYDNFSERSLKNDNIESSSEENNFSNKLKKEKNINVKSGKNMFSSLIKNILPDMESDRIFLLFLILMLQGQECDNGLLLALFYIIM